MSTTIPPHFPGGSECKESTCNAEDLGSIPGLERSPGGGQDKPFQYFCLEKPHGQRSLAGYIPCGHKELDMTEQLSTAHYHSSMPFIDCLRGTQSFSTEPFWLESKQTHLLFCVLTTTRTHIHIHREEQALLPVVGGSAVTCQVQLHFSPLGNRSAPSLLHFLFFCYEFKSKSITSP